MIISVGYRVNSINATKFRQWANKVLKEHLLRGYTINQRIEHLEQRVTKTEEKIDFFVRTSLPPVEGVFYDGQIFDAHVFVSNLIKSAKQRIILIDNYLDESVLVTDTVYHIGASLKDLGKKLFAFSKMEMPPETILRATL